MRFKDARKLGRKIITEECFTWVYLYQTKDKEWWISDCENFQSDNWYYLHRDGRILHYQLYENWERNTPLSASRYPFSPSVPKELYNIRKDN